MRLQPGKASFTCGGTLIILEPASKRTWLFSAPSSITSRGRGTPTACALPAWTTLRDQSPAPPRRRRRQHPDRLSPAGADIWRVSRRGRAAGRAIGADPQPYAPARHRRERLAARLHNADPAAAVARRARAARGDREAIPA